MFFNKKIEMPKREQGRRPRRGVLEMHLNPQSIVFIVFPPVMTAADAKKHCFPYILPLVLASLGVQFALEAPNIAFVVNAP